MTVSCWCCILRWKFRWMLSSRWGIEPATWTKWCFLLYHEVSAAPWGNSNRRRTSSVAQTNHWKNDSHTDPSHYKVLRHTEWYKVHYKVLPHTEWYKVHYKVLPHTERYKVHYKLWPHSERYKVGPTRYTTRNYQSHKGVKYTTSYYDTRYERYNVHRY